jgi:hypothetical protein
MSCILIVISVIISSNYVTAFSIMDLIDATTILITTLLLMTILTTLINMTLQICFQFAVISKVLISKICYK